MTDLINDQFGWIICKTVKMAVRIGYVTSVLIFAQLEGMDLLGAMTVKHLIIIHRYSDPNI